MRFSLVSALVAALLLTAHAQEGGPGGRPPQRTRLQAMLSGVMGDMSTMASRFRNGISRTFGSDSRNGNVRSGPAGFRNPPSEDPAIQTNEISPARQRDEDAPNAPGFAPQGGVRRPPSRGGSFSLRRMVDQVMGGMRNMFQGLNRRRGGGGPGRRVQQVPQEAHQQQHFQQQEHHQQHQPQHHQFAQQG